MVSSGTGRPTLPSRTIAKTAAYPQCSTKSVSNPITDNRAVELRLEPPLQVVHSSQLRLGRHDEVAWHSRIHQLRHAVGKTTRFVERSSLEDGALEPVPG